MVVQRHYRVLLMLALLAMAGYAWTRRFVMDDAFISFRYARNLVEGSGLVFNPGERVEGYTNFLWTLLLTMPFLARIDPVTFCFVIGLALFAGTLCLFSRLVLLCTESRPLALAGTLLLGLCPSFAGFATGGLETMLVSCLLTAMVLLLFFGAGERLVRPGRPRRAGQLGRGAALSALGAAALMTRPDAALAVAIVLLMAAFDLLRRKEATGRLFPVLAALAGPVSLILGVWLWWKLSYYGEILPNTLAAKTGGVQTWARGILYLRIFATSYLLAPWALLVAVSLPRMFRRSSFRTATMLAILASQVVYVAAIGGDFMEFRMMVPVLPLIVLLGLEAGSVWGPGSVAGVAVITLLAGGFVHHARTFTYTEGIESIEGLASHMDHPYSDWIGVGRGLGETFRNSPDVRIAVSAAGAIPYYSRLPTLDMLGLSDRWISRHGVVLEDQPGHARAAPFAYLVSQRINLVLGHPWIADRSPAQRSDYAFDELGRFVFLVDVSPENLPRGASIVECPLPGRRVLVCLYLTPHPVIETLVASGRWRRFRITT